ncbi:transcription factor [Pluteus cervinus]|uniref:Transcription factor n=1 Tax=Pluteus cervinus TaxID=181527 RepID=A0ACD3B550_9AGAR|nr:transcription factor [Pluteus cervinus]
MPDTQIFKATYSGIPVYEMMCKGVAVMRRRADSWLNATQILKVAGFDKPQRTRVLEREVQKGEHEKVQGGYGKYQGTWIPLERGLGLAKQYGCEHLLRPIIEFQPAAKSPPLAPKHLASTTPARTMRRGVHAEPVVSAPIVNTRSSRRHAPDAVEVESDRETLSARGSEDGSMTPSPSERSSSSRTPSPIRSPHPDAHGESHRSRGYHRRMDERYDEGSDHDSKGDGNGEPRTYGDQILEYFISDTNQIPQVLISPPQDFDPNMAIDDDGHTPLHWACAMGRIRIVKLLLTAGADIFKTNKAGQTPLMRSVMFANNYDVRKFPELYELLHRSTLNIDNYNRTVFHHVVDVALSKAKTHAARYYMETILQRLADFPKELADIINFQDEDGDTALTMAARCRSKRLVKLLIDYGADPKIANHDGKSTEDYILEDERFRSSPAPPSRSHSMIHHRNAPASSGSGIFPMSNGDRPPIHHSVAAHRASTRVAADVTAMLENLATAFDQELREKEKDITQAHALLANIQAEILESQRAVSHLKTQSDAFPAAQEHLEKLELALVEKMGRRYRLGWEKWVKDEELREKAVRDAAGEDWSLPSAMPVSQVDMDMESLIKLDGGEDGEEGADSGPGPDAKGKENANMETEDNSDIQRLYADIPTDSEGLKRACESLREEISGYRKRRKTIFDELVAFQAEAGTSGRMGEYRRLIGAGCGGVAPTEVDNVLGMLLETLESEEPSSSSTAWSGSRPATTVG